jgi:hypothetical protein
MAQRVSQLVSVCCYLGGANTVDLQYPVCVCVYVCMCVCVLMQENLDCRASSMHKGAKGEGQRVSQLETLETRCKLLFGSDKHCGLEVPCVCVYVCMLTMVMHIQRQ